MSFYVGEVGKRIEILIIGEERNDRKSIMEKAKSLDVKWKSI